MSEYKRIQSGKYESNNYKKRYILDPGKLENFRSTRSKPKIIKLK